MSGMTPQLQSGVLAYRHKGADKIEVLLVKKPHSQNWGIPKGKLEAGLAPYKNAAKEAFEEAGVTGRVGKEEIGSYRAIKRVADRKILIEVSVFPLEVTKVAKKWPEKAIRLIKWCSPMDAIKLLREPFLVQACRDIAENVLPQGRLDHPH